MTNVLIFIKLQVPKIKHFKEGAIMDNVLFKYFENRYNEANSKNSPQKKFGPIITLSRQSGCEAKHIAKLLVEKLNAKTAGAPWRFIDKEILEKSARELNLSESKISHFYEGHETSSFIDMFVSFSKSYVNDMKIKNTIRDIVSSFCNQGHIVLLGRGGAAILQDKASTLNIRLTAPFYWRIDTIMNNRKCSIETAEEWAIDTDEKRHKLFYTFLEKQPCNLDYLFDATLNRQNFSAEQSAEIILQLAKHKKLDI